MNPFWCPHTETTIADGSERAICTRCLTVVRTGVLTLRTLLRAQDFGLYGTTFEDAWGNRIDPRDVHAGPA